MSQLAKPEVSGAVAATAMFVEVLVIGIGALVSLFGYIAAVAGYGAMQKVAPILSSVPASGAALAFSYALGIVVDRAADSMLTLPRRRMRGRYFSTNSAYDEARRALVEYPHLVAMADYARSRMRVCRGWFMNSLLLTLSYSLLIWRFPAQNRLVLFVAGLVVGGLCAAGFYLSWRSITETGYKKLAQQAPEASARMPSQGNGAAANA